MVTESFTLAAAQVAPDYYDRAGTLDLACRWIERAGREGVDLVVFPEAFVPGYPYWKGAAGRERWTELMVDLQKASLHVDDDIAVLSDAIADAGVNVVLGANERDDRRGSETVYNALWYFDRTGDILGRHRKLMPTRTERAVWGRGDPASLHTYETDVGTLGGLICYENHMTLSKAALAALGEEIHAAVWPGFWELDGSLGAKSPAEDRRAVETCDIYAAVREYAVETQSFVVSCSGYVGDVPAGFEDEADGFDIAVGGSMLVSPAGIVKAGPALGEETLLTAEFDRDELRATKAYVDAMGHYARWDAVSLEVSDDVPAPVSIRGRDAPIAAERERIAKQHGIPVEAVDAVVEALRDDGNGAGIDG